MRKFIYGGLTALAVILTAASAVCAYDTRGYFAIGGEYLFLILPILFGPVIECELEMRRHENRRD